MRRPLVTLDRVDVRLGGVPVLADVTLALHAGEGLAVLGGNGAGKSTLLRLLRGELWPDPRGGRRLFHGPDGAFESPIGARERFARVAPEAQDAYLRNDWDLPVEAVIRSGFFDALWPSEAATPEQSRRVREVARALGVEGLLGRSVLELSRGEGRRVLLARALAPRPEALFLDEACDGLDAPARAGLLETVSAIARGGVAVVMATHRPEELVPELGRVVRLEGGRIAWEGDRAAALAGAGEAAPPSRAPRRGAGPRAALFQLRGATVLVDGRAVLDGVDWTVRAGERWSVTGPNGAGKSTLLRLLAGEEQPARGAVDRLGLGPRASAEDLRGRVGLVSPELQARHRFDARAADVVLSGFAGTVGLAVEPTARERALAAAAAERLGVTPLLERHVLSLSYGELRKVLIARALAPAPRALLLDEPLAGLDPAARAWVLRVLDELGAAGTAIVAVSHHADELPGAVDGRARLEAGRLAVDGA
ncbi:ATP-binding cassette domain-containing protein [Anaeromyxobacter sp. Red801]|uniref:ATP-binding cassette domain-containing protein n=1 Tax=Anaeromyxobacter sp. Red801 TaxID=3411632 RepID=UPI003BA0DE99